MTRSEIVETDKLNEWFIRWQSHRRVISVVPYELRSLKDLTATKVLVVFEEI